MAKICVSNRSAKVNCNTCKHDMYDVDYGEHCCYAKPNELGEVEWAPKEEREYPWHKK